MYLILVLLISASVPSSSEAIDYYPSPNNPNPVGLNRPRPSYQQTTPSYEQQPQNDKFHPFDNELLMKLDRSNENVFISPASIKATLAMILEGAKGESARQIAKQLNVRNLAASRQVIKDFIYGLKHGGSTTLEAGHGIFVSDQLEDDRTFNDYKKVIKDNYAAHVERIDFSKKAEASRNINAWVSKITHDLITEVLTPENFNQNSGLVLASALYFKGDWKYEFNPTLTQQRCFETSDKRCTKVRMMQITETFNYDLNTDLDAHVVELPYNDDAYSMLLIVPRTKGSSNIAAVLSRTNLKNILKTMDSSEVILHLPKFQIDYSTDLRAALDSMGIKDIFSRNANLTGISTSQQLIVDALMHRSRIDVGEKGTIAASVTTASVVPLIGNSSPVVIADHPFAFLIYNKEKKLVIFEGVVNQPTEAYSSDRFGNVLPIGANVDDEQPISTGQQQPFNPGRQQPISTGQQPISFGQQQPVSTGQQPISYGQQQPISTGRQQSINTGYQQPNSADQHQPIRQPQEQKVAQQYSTVSTGSGRTTPTLITPGVRYVDPQQLRASNPLHTQSQDIRGQAQDNLYEHDPFY